MVKKFLIMRHKFPGSRYKLSQIAEQNLRNSYSKKSLKCHVRKTNTAGAFCFHRVDQFSGANIPATQSTNLYFSPDAEGSLYILSSPRRSSFMVWGCVNYLVIIRSSRALLCNRPNLLFCYIPLSVRTLRWNS